MSESVPSFSTPKWTRVKGFLLLLAAVLGGAGLSAAGHDDILIAAVLVMGGGTVMYIAGLLVGYDIGERESREKP